MKICGLMKTTLLDFPGKVACTVFLGGCNLRCHFCHNSALAFEENGDFVSGNEFFAFLDRRKGVLDAVCVSGGEPLMHKEVFEFLKKIKNMGFLVKLDTNGCFPEMLERALASGSLDYVAMDIKGCLSAYGRCVGLNNFDTSKIKESIELLKNSNIDHEFRTTVVKGLHSKESLVDIAKLIAGEKRYFLQGFKMSDGVPDKTLSEFTKEEMENLLKAVREYVPDAELRGI